MGKLLNIHFVIKELPRIGVAVFSRPFADDEQELGWLRRQQRNVEVRLELLDRASSKALLEAHLRVPEVPEAVVDLVMDTVCFGTCAVCEGDPP